MQRNPSGTTGPSAASVVARRVPGIARLHAYQRTWLRADLVAGLSVFALLVAAGMAQGELAGLSPVVGLYTAIGSMTLYALFATSRHLMVGPEATCALLVASTVGAIAPGADPGRAALAAMAGNAGMGAAIGTGVGLAGGFLYGKHKESKQKAYQQGYQQGQQSR